MSVSARGPMGRKRRRRTAVAAAAVLTATGAALVGWLVEKAADSATDMLTGDAPLHVEVSEGPSPLRAFSVLVPETGAALGEPVLRNSSDDIMAWAGERGGVAADALGFELTVYGTTDHPLILKRIRAKVLTRSAPPNGTLFRPAGAGDLPLRPVVIDLDSADPVGRPGADDEHGEWAFPLQVSAADAERFSIEASTARAAVSFEIEIEYTDAGRARTQTIDDAGRPFVVAASSAATAEAAWEIEGDEVHIASR